MKHSPEPWTVGSRSGGSIGIDSYKHQGTSWFSFASVVVKMSDSESDKEEGHANLHRIIACVNAMAGIEDPEEFVKLAKFNAAGPIKAHPIAPTTLTESDRDKLCDILWWLRGYKKGANDNFEECPFDQSHLDSLNNVVNELREILNKKL